MVKVDSKLDFNHFFFNVECVFGLIIEEYKNKAFNRENNISAGVTFQLSVISEFAITFMHTVLNSSNVNHKKEKGLTLCIQNTSY